VLRDRAAHRDAEQVELADVEVVGERERVGGHVADLVRRVHPARLADIAVVEDDRAVAGRERRHLEHPRRAARREALHADQRLADSLLLVVQPHGIDVGERHCASSGRVRRL
jgi:hypothetical protein